MSANHRTLDENDVALIERVKLTPSLYDPRNVDFRMAHRKDEEWQKVASNLGLTINDAKRRWTCLRDRYSRELKLIRLHPGRNSGYGKNEFFRLMDFLRSFVRKRRERRSIASKTEDNNYWETGSTENYESKCYTTKLISVQPVNKQECDSKYDDYAEFSQDSTNYKSKLILEESDDFPVYMQQGNGDTYELVDTPTSQEDLTETSPETTTPTTRTESKPSKCVNNELTIVKELQTLQHHQQQSTSSCVMETEDDFFCKSVAVYLRQLSRRHKIKAKVEMFQILEKYIDIEETQDNQPNK